jgi:cytochrome P450
VAAWAVTNHVALTAVLSDPITFAKDPANWTAWRKERIPPDWELISWIAAPNMLNTDDPKHRRLRDLTSKAFTARQVQQLRPRVTTIAERLLEQMRELDIHAVDLKPAYALPLPLTVISELFGVPEGDRADMERLCATVFDQTITPQQAATNHQALQDFFTGLVEAKRQAPGDDLTSGLIEARDAGQQLSETELIWTLILMLGAGHETTVNLITNAAAALLAHDEQLQLLLDGTVPWSAAVEETLRWTPPIANMPFRYTTTDVTFDTVTVPAGEALLLCFAAAGGDPAAHGPDAERFDITRTQHLRHLAFGHGVHFCLGAPLARMEGAIALERLFATFDLAPAVKENQLRPMPSIVATGLAALPVTYTPRAPGLRVARD